MDPRLKLLKFIVLAASLFFAKSELRIALMTALLLILLVIFRGEMLRSSQGGLFMVLLLSGSIFLLHCFLTTDDGFGQISHAGCKKGAGLALTIISLWAAAKLLFGASKPRELVHAIGYFLPFSGRQGSFSNSFISIIQTGLIVFPVCKNKLSLARCSARARGGWIQLHPLRFRQNTERVMGFAFRRLFLASDEISGQLASRGFFGPKAGFDTLRARPIGFGQVALFILTTAGIQILLLA